VERKYAFILLITEKERFDVADEIGKVIATYTIKYKFGTLFYLNFLLYNLSPLYYYQ